jgi:iron complex outermembrane receptor protein
MRMLFTPVALAVACAFPVAAQDASEPARTLRPIVVTPTPGVAQEAFHTPASVDVVQGEDLRNAQLQVNLSEPLVRVPGVVAFNRQNYAQDLQISIRGFGARSTFGVRGLRLYTDGIPATAPDGQGQVSHFDLATADRLEVLRGPFSALYGNSSGGVVSLFTADGGPDKVMEASAAAGRYGVQRQSLRLSGAQGAWSWNLGATHFGTDGFREHSAATRNAFNGKVRLQATTDTRITFVANAVDMPQIQDPQGLNRAEFEATPRAAAPNALLFNTRKSVDQMQGGLIVEHRIDDVHALKLTAWRGARGTEQFLSVPVNTQQTTPGHAGGVIDLQRVYGGIDAQWIGRFRVAGGPLTLTAGVMADRLDERRKGFENFAGPVLGVMGALRRDEDNRVGSFDQYAQAQWDSEKLGLTAGVRHSVVRFRSRDRFITPANGDDSGAARYEATTPVLGVVYHASEALNLYASVGRGFETPTSNELSYRPGGAPGLNFRLQAARSTQLEVGAKADLARGWRANVALFEARTRDEIAVLANENGRSIFQNAGRTRRQGMELALTGDWGEGWSTYAALSYLDARYRDSVVAGVAGNRIPGIPRTTAYAELAWSRRPWGLETALELRHVGRILVDDANSDSAPASTVFNLRASLAQRLDRWTLREFVRVDNLGDRRYAGSVIVNAGFGRYFEPAPGRTWLVGVSAAYAF